MFLTKLLSINNSKMSLKLKHLLKHLDSMTRWDFFLPLVNTFKIGINKTFWGNDYVYNFRTIIDLNMKVCQLFEHSDISQMMH